MRCAHRRLRPRGIFTRWGGVTSSAILTVPRSSCSTSDEHRVHCRARVGHRELALYSSSGFKDPRGYDAHPLLRLACGAHQLATVVILYDGVSRLARHHRHRQSLRRAQPEPERARSLGWRRGENRVRARRGVIVPPGLSTSPGWSRPIARCRATLVAGMVFVLAVYACSLLLVDVRLRLASVSSTEGLQRATRSRPQRKALMITARPRL